MQEEEEEEEGLLYKLSFYVWAILRNPQGCKLTGSLLMSSRRKKKMSA